MITSIQNQQIKEWRKLHTKKARMTTRLFLIEGFHLIEEAYNSKWSIEQLIVQEGVDLPKWCQSLPIVTVTKKVFDYLAQTETPQGIVAVIKMKEVKPDVTGNVLLIDRIQDPGNLGTIIRTADAAGICQIVLGKGTVDLYNDKVIRATQGSLFHLSIVQADLTQKIHHLRENGYTIWATGLKNAINYKNLQVDHPIALIFGNEGAGIQQKLMKEADEIVTIPIYGQAESLNVSVAAGILMYYIQG